MTSFAVSSRRRVPFHASTCFLMQRNFEPMRSTPTERMSTRLRCLVCLASTGVNAPGSMLPSVLLGVGSIRRLHASTETPFDGQTLETIGCIKNDRSVPWVQKSNFKANWRIRGLLLVEMMRPKLPGLRTCPVVGSILPPEANRAFKLLIVLAKLGCLNRL